jgi:hypothetical protein
MGMPQGGEQTVQGRRSRFSFRRFQGMISVQAVSLPLWFRACSWGLLVCRGTVLEVLNACCRLRAARNPYKTADWGSAENVFRGRYQCQPLFLPSCLCSSLPLDCLCLRLLAICTIERPSPGFRPP